MSKQIKEKKEELKTNQPIGFALGKENFKLLLIGLGIILFGLVLLMGSANDNPAVFNTDIYSFRRIVLAPLVILSGFIFEIYAIMKKTKQD